MPAQPINGTDSTLCPGRSRLRRQSRFSSSRILNSGWLQHLSFQFAQQRNHLLASHTGKSFQKLIDRFTGFQMIKKALNRHARPNEHRCPAQNLGIGVIAFLHAWRLTPFRGGHNCTFPNRCISMRHIGGRKTVPPRFFGYTLFGQCQKARTCFLHPTMTGPSDSERFHYRCLRCASGLENHFGDEQ